MLIQCPTCGGRGSVPDPKCVGRAMLYYNPETGNSCPHVTCQSCAGSGWVEDETDRHRAPVAPTGD